MALVRLAATATDTLAGLADTANKEYRLAAASATSAVEHAIRCGEVLLEAQAQVPAGKWGAWCKRNVSDINESTITKFCRLATHKEAIAIGEFSTIERALGYLRQLGKPPRPSGPQRTYKTFDHDEAHRLAGKGLTYKQIGEALGVSDQTIGTHLDPERRQKKRTYMRQYGRQQREARDALAAQNREKAVRATKGLPAEAYAMLRKTALVLDKAISECTDPTERTKLQAAQGFVFKAEDEIVRALRLERML